MAPVFFESMILLVNLLKKVLLHLNVNRADGFTQHFKLKSGKDSQLDPSLPIQQGLEQQCEP